MQQSRLIRHASGLTVGLGLQFLLGMWANVGASFPKTEEAGQHWKFALSQASIVLHITLGTLLVLGALALVVFSFRFGKRLWKAGSGIGFGALLLAWLAGKEFVSTQQDRYSFLMALFFIIALFAYITTIYLALSVQTEPQKR